MRYILVVLLLTFGIGKALGMCCLLGVITSSDPFFTKSNHVTAGLLALLAGLCALVDFIAAVILFTN